MCSTRNGNACGFRTSSANEAWQALRAGSDVQPGVQVQSQEGVVANLVKKEPAARQDRDLVPWTSSRAHSLVDTDLCLHTDEGAEVDREDAESAPSDEADVDTTRGPRRC